jgi:hypothetical protein
MSSSKKKSKPKQFPDTVFVKVVTSRRATDSELDCSENADAFMPQESGGKVLLGEYHLANIVEVSQTVTTNVVPINKGKMKYNKKPGPEDN